MINLTEIANSKTLKKAAKNIAYNNDLWQDLFQEMLLIIAQTKEDKINDINQYCIRVMLNQYRSKTSKFYKDYRHLNDEVLDITLLSNTHSDSYDENFEVEYKKRCDKIEEVRMELPINERIVHEIYFREKTSTRKISQQTGIPYRTIATYLKNANEKIRERCKQL